MTTPTIPHFDLIKAEYGSLVGKTVVAVRPLMADELENLFWFDGGTVAFVIFFSDGSFVIPSSDAEGNGAGSLIYEPAR
jgi:hypothetical protein